MFIQNDVLKEFIARGTQIFPPEASLRLAVDTIEHIARRVPTWVPLAMSGYHIRESGADAVQEIAFTFSNARAYLDECLRRGLTVDEVAPTLYTFLAITMDFLPEVAKFRAARRVWATLMRDTYGARDPRSQQLAHLRVHGRLVADRAAADEQRRAHHDRGHGRGARGRADDARLRVRRGARRPDRDRREPGAAHPARRRFRDRAGRYRRPARGVLRGGGTHRRPRAADPATRWTTSPRGAAPSPASSPAGSPRSSPTRPTGRPARSRKAIAWWSA